MTRMLERRESVNLVLKNSDIKNDELYNGKNRA
jgi:hypothetical protein